MTATVAIDFRKILSLSGTGITFARSGAANYFSPSTGLLVSAAGGVPRFGASTYGVLRQDGLLRECAATNQLKYCRDLTQSTWTKSGVSVVLSATGIDGATNTATTLTATSAGGTVLQAYTATAATRNASVFLRRLSGTGTVSISSDGTNFTSVSLTTGWKRFGVAANGANPQLVIKLATSGDSIAVDYAQLEDGGQPTTPILTTSASASRGGETVKYTSLSSVFNTAQGTIVGGFLHNGNPADGEYPWQFMLCDDAAYNTQVGFYVSGSSQAVMGKAVTQNTSRFDGLCWEDFIEGQHVVAAMGYSSGHWAGSVNGSAIDSGSLTAVPDSCDTVLLGDGQSEASGIITFFEYYNTLLSDAAIVTAAARTGYPYQQAVASLGLSASIVKHMLGWERRWAGAAFSAEGQPMLLTRELWLALTTAAYTSTLRSVSWVRALVLRVSSCSLAATLWGAVLSGAVQTYSFGVGAINAVVSLGRAVLGIFPERVVRSRRGIISSLTKCPARITVKISSPAKISVRTLWSRSL